ncbi:MAG TPA: alkane 1-monooxygenase [Caulobacteraceae bacterium]|jgi:alkane 1-monooxygenase|nr:alkane 1-monooxygenase [Caulobacteraceae bacterium]
MLRPLRFALPFLFLATVPLGFALGGVGSFLTLALMPLAIASLDGVLGAAAGAPGARHEGVYRLLPRLYILAQLGVCVWAALQVMSPATSTLEMVGLTLSVGLTAGVFGMLAAHEMVHSASAADRALGLGFLAGVGYMQFRIAHVHGHHTRAATREDPASGRRGENAYLFALRSVAGQTREAWTFEAERLRRKGLGVWSMRNRMLCYALVELIVLAGAASLGPRVLAFFVGQAVIAVFMLELFNYIAHYGLERRLEADGSFERLAARHSWNSARRMNNWSLFNMGRHADHHRSPMQSFHRLEAVEGSPELPTGYAGAILMALAPPLWRHVMDPRVAHWENLPRQGLAFAAKASQISAK